MTLNNTTNEGTPQTTFCQGLAPVGKRECICGSPRRRSISLGFYAHPSLAAPLCGHAARSTYLDAHRIIALRPSCPRSPRSGVTISVTRRPQLGFTSASSFLINFVTTKPSPTPANFIRPPALYSISKSSISTGQAARRHVHHGWRFARRSNSATRCSLPWFFTGLRFADNGDNRVDVFHGDPQARTMTRLRAHPG